MKMDNSITDITIKNINGRTVISPVTSLTHKNCGQLDRLFKDLFSKGIMDIVIDMNAVPFMDSSALELLVEMHARLETNGHNLVLSNINDVCRDILVCVRLYNRFRIIASRHST